MKRSPISLQLGAQIWACSVYAPTVPFAAGKVAGSSAVFSAGKTAGLSVGIQKWQMDWTGLDGEETISE